MRIQFSIDENKIIEERSIKNENFEEQFIPIEAKGNYVTLAVLVNDPHKFNMFIEKVAKDQEAGGTKTSNVIGAEIASIELRPPVNTKALEEIRDQINELLYGAKPKEEAEVVNEEDQYEKSDDEESYEENVIEDAEIISEEEDNVNN